MMMALSATYYLEKIPNLSLIIPCIDNTRDLTFLEVYIDTGVMGQNKPIFQAISICSITWLGAPVPYCPTYRNKKYL